MLVEISRVMNAIESAAATELRRLESDPCIRAQVRAPVIREARALVANIRHAVYLVCEVDDGLIRPQKPTGANHA